MQFAAKVKPEQPCSGYMDNYMPSNSCHEQSSPVVTALNSQSLGKSVFTKEGNTFALQTAAALQKLRANSNCGFNGMQLHQQQQQQAFTFRVPNSSSNPAPTVGKYHSQNVPEIFFNTTTRIWSTLSNDLNLSVKLLFSQIKSLLYTYYLTTLKSVYYPENPHSWKCICPCCTHLAVSSPVSVAVFNKEQQL